MHLRHRRFRGLRDWFVPEIISGLSLLLQIALFFFLGGLVTLLWTIDNTVAFVITAAVFSFLSAFALTAMLPAMLIECPYRSPLAWGFYITASPIVQPILQSIYGSFHWLLWYLPVAAPQGTDQSFISRLRSWLESFRFRVLGRLRATDQPPRSWYDREVQAIWLPMFEQDLSAIIWASRTYYSSQVDWIVHCLLDGMNPREALLHWIASTSRPRSTYSQVLSAAKNNATFANFQGNWLREDVDRDVACMLLEYACRYSLSQPANVEVDEAALLNLISQLAPVNSSSDIKRYILRVMELTGDHAAEEAVKLVSLQILEQYQHVTAPASQLIPSGTSTIPPEVPQSVSSEVMSAFQVAPGLSSGH